MMIRAATAANGWSLPRFWVSIRSYKKLVKKNWGRIVDLVWLKFAVAALEIVDFLVLYLLQT